MGEFAYAQILEKIRTEISVKHGVAPYTVLLLSPRSIDKTTSGKIARQWVKKAYVKGALKEIKVWRGLGADTGTQGSPAFVSEDIDSFVPQKSAPADRMPEGYAVPTEEGFEVFDPTIMPLEQVLGLLQVRRTWR